MIGSMVLVKGFLLGIASGGACLAYCAPVLVPYLLGEGKTLRGNAVLVGGFLGGRLIGYLAFAAGRMGSARRHSWRTCPTGRPSPAGSRSPWPFS